MLGQINRDLAPMKAHFFLYNAATGPMISFLPTIAKQLGFSGFLTGKMFTILPISGLIAKPLFGGFADKFRLHKIFFIAFQAILAIAFFTINFLPESIHQEKLGAASNLVCNDPAFLELCGKRPFSDQEYEAMRIASKNYSNCHLSCEIQSIDNVQVICNSWNVSDYCTLLKTVKPNEIKNLEKLDFKVQFNQSFNINLRHCLEIRLFNAVFANGDIYKTSCPAPKSFFRIPCRVRCPEVPFLNTLIEEISQTEEPKPKQISTWILHWFLGASIVSWIGMAVVVSIGDAICFDLLGDANSRDYGKQKMWGSVGVGIFGISAGYLTDLISKGSETKDYSFIFYIMLIMMIFDIIVSSKLKKSSLNSTNEPSILYELWPILKESRVLVFAWWCIGAGMCTGVVWNFLFWYTEIISTEPSHQEWLKTLQGLLIGVQCFLGEMPFNFISDSILRKVGHINVMSLVLLVYAIRFMAYSMIANPWIFLFFEILHGPSVGLCWPTMVSYGDKVAPSGTKATMQGFIGAVFEGIGVASGSLICGYLIDRYKGPIIFRIFSVGALTWLTIFWLLQLLLRKVKAYPLQQGHSHLASYVPPDDDAILMTMSQEMQTY